MVEIVVILLMANLFVAKHLRVTVVTFAMTPNTVPKNAPISDKLKHAAILGTKAKLKKLIPDLLMYPS